MTLSTARADTGALRAVAHGPAAAPPVVLLHGFLGDARDWEPIATALAASFRVYALDLPGHGGSPPVAEAEAFYDALAAWCDAFVEGPVGLVGYSMGGRLALQWTCRHPQRVARLVLESASPGLQAQAERMPRLRHDAHVADTLAACQDAGTFARWLEDWYAQPLFATLAEHPEARAAMLQRRRAGQPAAMAQALRTFGVARLPDCWGELPALTLPVLCVAGERDQKYRQLAERMVSRLPHAAPEVMCGCGHNVHVENPGGYTAVSRAFLARSAV